MVTLRKQSPFGAISMNSCNSSLWDSGPKVGSIVCAFFLHVHYFNVTWASLRSKYDNSIVCSTARLAHNKENIEAPRY